MVTITNKDNEYNGNINDIKDNHYANNDNTLYKKHLKFPNFTRIY